MPHMSAPVIEKLCAKEAKLNFPDDADGDVLRRLDESGFDFSKSTTIDFNVDFNSWPPHPVAISRLKEYAGAVEIYEPDEEYSGYVLFHIHQILSYELVVDTQKSVTALMAEYGGVCESWGVLS
jgi:hypothetical protein